jgi:hypothetical protein
MASSSRTLCFSYTPVYAYIETEVVIDAPVDQVWAVFADFGGWPQWTSGFMRFTEPPTAVGRRCGLVCKLSQGAVKSTNHWPMVRGAGAAAAPTARAGPVEASAAAAGSSCSGQQLRRRGAAVGFRPLLPCPRLGPRRPGAAAGAPAPPPCSAAAGRPATSPPAGRPPPAQVEVFDQGRELMWRDFSYVLSPFWHGCHWFRFDPLPDGRTRLRHGTRQMGLAMPALWHAMKSTEIGYHEFNVELAAEVARRRAASQAARPAGAAAAARAPTEAQVGGRAGRKGCVAGQLAPRSDASPAAKGAGETGVQTRRMASAQGL